MSANFTGVTAPAGPHGYAGNLSLLLMNCLLKFVVDLAGTSVVSVFSRTLVLAPPQRERLMKFGVTFAHADYSRGHEPVYMNDFRFYSDIYLIHVEDARLFDGLVKQLHAAQLILNPDRQAFIFLWTGGGGALKNEPAGAPFERFFRSASEYIFEFIVIAGNRFCANATHRLPEHQRLIHALGGNHVGYYYWNSCLDQPRAITAAAVNFQSKEHLREYFSAGRLCPPKVDRLRVRLSAWAPFVDEPDPPGSLHFTSGLDIQLITSIAHQLNVSLEYSDSPNGWSDDFRNATAENNWKALQVQEVDLVLSSTITTRARYKHFHATVSYFHDSDGFCVPVALKLPQYQKWSEVVDIYVALFAMYLIFVPVLYYFGKKYNPHVTIGNVYIYSLASLCSLSTPRLLNGERVRWLYMCWLLYCFLLNIYYQSKLISIMYHPSYAKQVSNQPDLINSDYHILFLAHYMRYFEGPFDPKLDNIQYRIQQRIEPCVDTSICLKNVSYDRNSAMCIQKTYLKFRMDQYTDDYGSPLIYCFKEPINLSPIVFHVNRNFPLVRPLDRQIMNIKETGLVAKWAEDIFRKTMHLKKKRSSSVTEYRPLELGMLRILFYLYLVGVGLAICGFIAEIIYYRCYIDAN